MANTITTQKISKRQEISSMVTFLELDHVWSPKILILEALLMLNPFFRPLIYKLQLFLISI